MRLGRLNILNNILNACTRPLRRVRRYYNIVMAWRMKCVYCVITRFSWLIKGIVASGKRSACCMNVYIDSYMPIRRSNPRGSPRYCQSRGRYTARASAGAYKYYGGRRYRWKTWTSSYKERCGSCSTAKVSSTIYTFQRLCTRTENIIILL